MFKQVIKTNADAPWTVIAKIHEGHILCDIWPNDRSADDVQFTCGYKLTAGEAQKLAEGFFKLSLELMESKK